MRVARDSGHEEPGALPGRRWQGCLRGRRCGGGAGNQRGRRTRRNRAHRRAVRVAASRGRPGGRTQRPCGHARRAWDQQELPVGPQDRGPRGRHRRGLCRCRIHGEGSLHPAAPAADGDGAACGCGSAAAIRRRHHPVLQHPGATHSQDHERHHAGHPRAPVARRHPHGRWRLRQQARPIRRGTAVPGAGPQAQASRAVERGARRERCCHHSRSRSDPGHGAGGRHSAGRKRRTPSSARSIHWHTRWASTRWSCVGETSSARTSFRTPR